MRDNNITKNSDIVLKKNYSEIQNLVPSRINQSRISSSITIKLLSTQNNVSSQTEYKTQLNTTVYTTRPPIKYNI